MSLILASKSPRRQQLLRMLGVDFTVHTADIDETMWPYETPAQAVARVSGLKAQAVAALHQPEDIVISADTIVVVEGEILGKPADQADASRMLHLLSGRTHQVLTAISVLAKGQQETRVVTTDVTFRTLTDREIDFYIASGDPMDKAGSYGIQGYPAVFVSHIDGDFYSVMGLSVCTLWQMLEPHLELTELG